MQLVLGGAWTGARLVLPATSAVFNSAARARLPSRCGRVVGAELWRQGPALAKLGQLLAGREDLVDARFCAGLREVLIERRTVADGVHRGSVADVVIERDTDRVVKRIRPGVRDELDRDLCLVEHCAELWARVMGVSGGRQLVALTRGLTGAVRNQCDLVLEGRSLRQLAVGLGDRQPVVFPTVLPGSNREQLVMTFLPGQHPRAERPPAELARGLLLVMYEMLFVTGVVHCDLHTGNWWPTEDGALAIVDAGFVHHIDPTMRRALAGFFLGLATDDGVNCARYARQALVDPVALADPPRYADDIGNLVSANSALTAREFSLVRFARGLFDIHRRHQAPLRADFVLPLTALLAVEGQIRVLDPDLNFQLLADSAIRRCLFGEASGGPGM